ncbi:MAG: hypothetical protein M3137_06315 [Actinomycetota bacterium]|nr:hypothetical protein [Actinomycetota bacterium]
MGDQEGALLVAHDCCGQVHGSIFRPPAQRLDRVDVAVTGAERRAGQMLCLVVAHELHPPAGVHRHHTIDKSDRLVAVGPLVHQISDLHHRQITRDLCGLQVDA